MIVKAMKEQMTDVRNGARLTALISKNVITDTPMTYEDPDSSRKIISKRPILKEYNCLKSGLLMQGYSAPNNKISDYLRGY